MLLLILILIVHENEKYSYFCCCHLSFEEFKILDFFYYVLGLFFLFSWKEKQSMFIDDYCSKTNLSVNIRIILLILISISHSFRFCFFVLYFLCLRLLLLLRSYLSTFLSYRRETIQCLCNVAKLIRKYDGLMPLCMCKSL